MADTNTPGSGIPGFGDVFSMFGAANPLASIGKTIEQFKRGVNDFLLAVENFNATMQTLNGVATRVSALMDDVEEPIRAFMPQVTRSIKAADALINQISGPIEKVAPGINRLADTLGSPVFTTMPSDIANFVDMMTDVAQRLQPLAQMAENAGSMFGLRSIGGALGGALRGGRPQPVVPPPPTPVVAPPAAKAPAKRAAAKKAPVKKPAAKTAPVKRAAAKKAPATRRP
jgi:hypothetical protein